MNSDILKTSALSGLAFAILMSMAFLFLFGVYMEVFLFTFFMAFIGWFLLILVFLNRVALQGERMVNEFIKELSIQKEDIIYQGLANHFVGMESVGGNLVITKDRLIFKSHDVAINQHMLTVFLNDIKGIEYYDNLGFIPNGIKIFYGNNVDKFVVNGRDKIAKLLQNYNIKV